MYAVIETAGKQYRVELGTVLEIDRMDAEPGQTVQLERVLLIADGDTTEIGRPTVAGAAVAADVVRHDRGEKIVVFKYRPKARHRAKQGHRQDLTVLRVSDIAWSDRSAAADAREREATDQRAAQAAGRDADRRAAADRALADKLTREETPEHPADAGDGTASAPSTSSRKASTRPARTATRKPATTEASTKVTGRNEGSAAASRTQAPSPKQAATPKKDAPRRRATKKDE